MTELRVTEGGISISDGEPAGRCWLRHKWSRWETIETGNIICRAKDGTKRTTGQFINQRKVCLRCGKVKLDMQQVEL